MASGQLVASAAGGGAMPFLSDTDPQGPPKLGLVLLQGLVLSMFFVFSLRLWYMQVHKGEEYSKQAKENQLRREVIYAPPLVPSWTRRGGWWPSTSPVMP